MLSQCSFEPSFCQAPELLKRSSISTDTLCGSQKHLIVYLA